jgi:hypothetical protein
MVVRDVSFIESLVAMGMASDLKRVCIRDME